MMLVPELDENRTKENVRELLKDYRHMKRMATFSGNDRQYDTLKAIQYDDMPRSDSNRNGSEHQMIKRLRQVSKISQGYTKRVYAVDRAIAALPTISGQILLLGYCSKDRHSMNEIAAKIKGYRVNELGEYEEFFYTVKNIERLKSKALIEFAEAYGDGELLAFKN